MLGTYITNSEYLRQYCTPLYWQAVLSGDRTSGLLPATACHPRRCTVLQSRGCKAPRRMCRGEGPSKQAAVEPCGRGAHDADPQKSRADTPRGQEGMLLRLDRRTPPGCCKGTQTSTNTPTVAATFTPGPCSQAHTKLLVGQRPEGGNGAHADEAQHACTPPRARCTCGMHGRMQGGIQSTRTSGARLLMCVKMAGDSLRQSTVRKVYGRTAVQGDKEAGSGAPRSPFRSCARDGAGRRRQTRSHLPEERPRPRRRRRRRRTQTRGCHRLRSSAPGRPRKWVSLPRAAQERGSVGVSLAQNGG